MSASLSEAARPEGRTAGGAVSSLNWYANVGTRRDVQRSTWSAGQAKFASETSTLSAPTADP